MRVVRGVATFCGAAAACVLAYRGVKLYFKNEIIVSITEIVRLPPSSGVMVARTRGSSEPLVVQGKIEIETCTMRSYRYLLKLAAHLYQDELQASLSASGTSNGSWAVGASTGGGAKAVASGRRRVASTLPNSFMRPGNNGDYYGSEGASSSRELTVASNTSDASMRSAKLGSGSGRGGGGGGGQPVLVVNDVHYMVDQYEVMDTNHVCFTPPCITYATLMRYMGTVVTAVPASASSPEPSAMAAVREGNPLSTIAIHNCYLKADKSAAYAHSLSFDLEVVRSVSGLKVLINLPHRHCRMTRAITNGVGYVMARRDGKPHQCVWEIGQVDESHGAASAKTDGAVDVRVERELAGEEQVRILYTSFELIYTDARTSSYDRDNSEYDASDFDDDDADDEDDVFSRTTRSSGGHSRAATSRTQSNKSRKREERSKKKQEASQRRAEGMMLSARGASTKIPTVEVTYSCPGLATGATVRKLQLLEDKPNWRPRSLFDKYVLRHVMYGLENLKLKKLAHYTTWFLQPVLVTQME